MTTEVKETWKNWNGVELNDQMFISAFEQDGGATDFSWSRWFSMEQSYPTLYALLKDHDGYGSGGYTHASGTCITCGARGVSVTDVCLYIPTDQWIEGTLRRKERVITVIDRYRDHPYH